MKLNEINEYTGLLWNGFDYEQQAWVLRGIYQDCGHPRSMGPTCCNAHALAVSGLTVKEVSLIAV